jgi:uncharacterized protein
MAPDNTTELLHDPAGEVSGVLHLPGQSNACGLVLTHGAGGSKDAALLVALANEFAARGFAVLRCDLPFRQLRPHGPPRPGDAAKDRAGLSRALDALRRRVSSRVFVGGQSYGGRQASMLAEETPGVADGLLLLSYPLHPPGKPAQLRTQHFPGLSLPALFVQGTKDPFGSIQEIQAAVKLIPGRTAILTVDGGGHDLGYGGRGKSRDTTLPARIYSEFERLIA